LGSRLLARDNDVDVVTAAQAVIGHRQQAVAAMRFANAGMKVCIADIGQERLKEADSKLLSAACGPLDIMTAAVDVSRIEQLQQLERAVQERLGGTDILMNNAGIQPKSQMFGPHENWQRILSVNLWGVINGSQVFAPQMIARGRPGMIINTGSRSLPRKLICAPSHPAPRRYGCVDCAAASATHRSRPARHRAPLLLGWTIVADKYQTLQ
jgi:NAD(P)-dependent dehydrogenase (short-subunit alcohol dehydrogenase family)